MNFHKALERLQSSREFKKFREENKKAYLSSAFFVLDYETGTKTSQLDFFLPDENKICLFTIDKAITSKIDDILQKKEKKIEKLNLEIKIEIKDAEKTAWKECKKKIKKIFAVLQKHQGKQMWNMTCILEGANLFKIKIDADSGEVLNKEESNLMDFIKKS